MRKKQKAARILRERGLNMSTSIRTMIYTIADTGKIPLQQAPYKPNEETAKAIHDAQAGVGLSEAFTSVDELFRALDT